MPGSAVPAILNFSRRSGHRSRNGLKFDAEAADTTSMPSALSPRRRTDAPSRPRPASRLTDDQAARNTSSQVPVIALLAAPVPAPTLLRTCTADDDLAWQLVQLARLGAATLLAHQQPAPFSAVAGRPNRGPLTSRETQLLRLISNGSTVKQAAELAGCSQSTANTHLSNAYRKLGVTDRTQAVLTARAKRLF